MGVRFLVVKPYYYSGIPISESSDDVFVSMTYKDSATTPTPHTISIINYSSSSTDTRYIQFTALRNMGTNQYPFFTLADFISSIRILKFNEDGETVRQEMQTYAGGYQAANYSKAYEWIENLNPNRYEELSSMPIEYNFEWVIDNQSTIVEYNTRNRGAYICTCKFNPVEDTINNYCYIMVIPPYQNWVHWKTRNTTYNLTNCTSNYIDIPQIATRVTITANSGYSFNSVNDVTISESVTNKTIASDKKSISFTTNRDTVNINITATATQDIAGFTFTNNLTNCTSDIATGIYPENTSMQVTFTPNSVSSVYEDIAGYEFVDLPTSTDSSVVFTRDGNNIVAEWTLTQDVTITANAILYMLMDMEHLVNATCNISATTHLYTGQSYNITVTANEGYYFDEVPYISYQDSWAVWQELELTTTQTSEYKTIYSGTFTVDRNYDFKTLYASAIVTPVIETDEYGFIRVYKPTIDDLKSLAAIRFTTQSNIDLADYILELKKLYINLNSSTIEEMKLGDFLTGIRTTLVQTVTVTTNLGTCDIEYYFENVMDYQNTKIECYLPFKGFVELDTNKVMNKTLKIYYVTNVISGDTVIYIDDNQTENHLYTFTTNLASDIPYITAQHYTPKVENQLSINNRYLYGFEPFINIIRDREYNTANRRGNSNEYVKLSTLTGFNTVEVNEIGIEATHNELNEIETILRNGVIF